MITSVMREEGMRRFRDIDDELLFEVCKMFLSGDMGVKKIADALNARWKNRGINRSVTREQIYSMINEARKRGYFILSPPLNHAVGQRIADRYQKDPASIHVVPVRKNLGDVASATAGLALDLIQRLGEKKDKKNKKHTVHLGLGAGWTTMLIAEELAKRLRAAEKIRPLSLHAMTPGFEIERPRSAPASFFGFFANLGVPIDFVGLFAPAVVRTRDYANTKRWPVVAEAFARAKKVELVITSLASAADPHGDLNTFAEEGGLDRRRAVPPLLEQRADDDGYGCSRRDPLRAFRSRRTGEVGRHAGGARIRAVCGGGLQPLARRRLEAAPRRAEAQGLESPRARPRHGGGAALVARASRAASRLAPTQSSIFVH
jgi:hypothetical protein